MAGVLFSAPSPVGALASYTAAASSDFELLDAGGMTVTATPTGGDAIFAT